MAQNDLLVSSKKRKSRKVLKLIFAGLPLAGVVWASFLPLQTWMQQALILVVLLWFYAFFLLDVFFLKG